MSSPPYTPLGTQYEHPIQGHEMGDYSSSTASDKRAFAQGNLIPARGRTSWILDGWIWEILGLILSICCLGALIGILIWVNGKPLSDWDVPISLNATVAVFSTVIKSVLLMVVAECISQLKWFHFGRMHTLYDMELFDQASRGPYGSMILLLKVRNVLAWLGAIITIVALAIDPFSQQILAFPQRDVVQNNASVAKFGFSHSFYSGAIASGLGGFGYYGQQWAQDVQMRGAIARGLYGIDVSPQFTCASSCTWPGPYVTLGYTSTCQNVTEASLKTMKCGRDKGGGGSVCNMTTPRGIDLQVVFIPTEIATVLYVNSTAEMMHFRFDANQNVRANASNEVIAFAVYQRNAKDAENPPTNVTAAQEIVECQIRHVAHKYSNLSTSGPTLNIGKTEVIDLPVGIYEDRPDRPIWFNHTDLPALSINAVDWQSVQDYLLRGIFNGTIFAGGQPSQEAIVQAAGFFGKNVTSIVERMTASMTERLRTGPQQQAATGITMGSQPFVHVRWVWMSLSIITAVLVALLLLATALYRGNGRETALWKSSAAALLFYQLEGWQSNAVIPTRTVLEEQTKVLRAKLDNKGTMSFTAG
ncbi:hypothetical protein EJ06DRAFT_546940 [Trichodelitschia bisporula]|uniref:Uncharacterized protein n=1 Tax=Trichodelitschia bisporula TaxID=703511 RepID=A0A6G1I6D3_9PEZI|nr:hypothetical protein EJ06DRAFT_546940 [Trichodelitschia bisporula]